jgi:selenocysteine lyase/cysteine desulfurase
LQDQLSLKEAFRGTTEPAFWNPSGAVRVGIVHYNTAAEVDRLLAELDRVPG